MHMDERRNAACRVDSSDTELASTGLTQERVEATRERALVEST